jgi:hypothetical protein
VFLAIARGINFNLFYDSDFFFLFISSFHVQWGVGCGNFHLSSSLLNKTIDVLLYVDRLDAYRVDNLDKQVVKAITDSFGKGIWNRAFIVLTHAQLSPPDGLPYEDFYSKRSGALLKVVRVGAGLKKQDKKVHPFYLFSFFYFCNLKFNMCFSFFIPLYCHW